jgi:hypothetical protein
MRRFSSQPSVTFDRATSHRHPPRVRIGATVPNVVGATTASPDTFACQPLITRVAMKLFLRLTACAVAILLTSSIAALAWDRSDQAAAPRNSALPPISH